MIRRLFWLLFALSLAGTAASSLALFAGPSSEVAQWAHWSFLGLSRARWESLHMGLGALMVLAGAVCLLAGSRRMMAAGEDGRDATPAWITALLVFGVLVVASASMLPPGGTLAQLSASLKAWHAKSFGEPPLAAAANMTPTELAKRLSLDPAQALANLAGHNVRLASPDATLAEIAQANRLAPAAVYETMRGGKEARLPAPPALDPPKAQAPPVPALPADPPPGLGRLKLVDVCEQYGLNLNGAVERLAKAGIKASGDMTLRQIAQNNLMLPIEVYDSLRGLTKDEKGAPAPAVPAPPTQAVSAAPAPGVPGEQPGQPVPPLPAVQAPGGVPQNVPQVPVIAAEHLERMTLAAFCRDHSIETAQALARLKAKGIVAFSDMTFRELAIENNLTAEQVMQLMIR